MNPKITVIIPVYNREKYINRCIESILSQTFQDFEIIAVDDCSSDKTVQTIEEKAYTDRRIKIIYHKKNQGSMVARKTGYTNAKGEYIVFVDSDDYLPKDALETLYKEISKRDADIVLSDFQYIGIKHSWKNKKNH